jgi:hypothetical protein
MSGTVSFIESQPTVRNLPPNTWAAWPLLRLYAGHSYIYGDPAIQSIYFFLNARYALKEEP